MAHQLHRYAAAVAQVPARAVAEAGDQLADIAGDEARRVTGDGRLSGMGRRGPRLRATVTVRTRGDSATAELVGVPAGAWALLESGARPHRIGTARGPVLYGRGMAHPVRGPVQHPGARGQGTWTRTIAQAPRVLEDVTAAELARIL